MSHPNTEDTHPPAVGFWWDRRRVLRLLLGVTFIHGLVYLAVLPPWQHYDEPTHFEYVRLMVERNRLPKPGDYDLTMRREIAASMQAAGFYRDLGTPPNQFLSDQPPNIGISELEHPPLYYILLALPQKLVMYQDVETQLYVARMTSLLLYLVVVAAAYGLVGELFPTRRWLAVSVALFIALLPPLADLMSAVNNDVGAAAAVSLLLWAGARMIRRGFSLWRVAVVLVLTAACAATKSTALYVAIAAVLALGIGFVPRRARRWVWGAVALAIPLALVAAVTWGAQAAHWQSSDEPSAPSRARIETPLGKSALVLTADGSGYPRSLFQELDRAAGRDLAGETVTLGAWVKAPAGSEGTFRLQLNDGAGGPSYQGDATADWTFQAFTATLRADAPGLAIQVSLPNRQDAAQELYVDGLALVGGEAPTNETPQFVNAQDTVLEWGAITRSNLLKNGSAEAAWPGMRDWVGSQQIYRTPIAAVFQSLWDWPRTGWMYRPELSLLVQSFWGRFAWNHLALPAPYFTALGFATLLAVAGAGIGLVRRLRAPRSIEPWKWQAWGMMAAAFGAAWCGTILRMHPIFITRHMFWPGARYAVGAIIPTATLLCLGLSEIVPRRWLHEAAWLGLLGLIGLDAIALWTVILPYYYA